jgi:hypothetical protein
MIIRDYIGTIYSNKWENPEVDKFLDAYDKPKLRKEVINHINKSITSNKIEGVRVSQREKYNSWWIQT